MIIEGYIRVFDRARAGALRGAVRLEDVSEADAPSKVIAAVPLELGEGVARAPFRLTLDGAPDPRRHYLVTARLEGTDKATGGLLVFGTTAAHPFDPETASEIAVEVRPWT
jgi:uncharacterized lipoprotein YbaY